MRTFTEIEVFLLFLASGAAFALLLVILRLPERIIKLLLGISCKDFNRSSDTKDNVRHSQDNVNIASSENNDDSKKDDNKKIGKNFSVGKNWKVLYVIVRTLFDCVFIGMAFYVLPRCFLVINSGKTDFFCFIAWLIGFFCVSQPLFKLLDKAGNILYNRRIVKCGGKNADAVK